MSAYDVSDFHAEVIERSRAVPVLVDFWADWCGPCKALGPVLENLAGAAGDRWVLAKVDTEVHREVAGRYGIRSIPNVKLFVDGEPVSEFVGALPEAQVTQWLDEVLPNARSEALRAARELLASGESSSAGAAVELLAGLLAEDEDDTEAGALLAEAKLFDDPSQALALLEPAISKAPLDVHLVALCAIARLLTLEEEGGEALPDGPLKVAYLDAAEALRRRDYGAALDGFIEVAGKDREFDADGAREACLAIFEVLGPDSPITREGRRALARALFV